MKPAPFDLLAPRTLDEAVDVLHGREADARVLAGGQSLVPAMALRLATPSALVDLNRIPDLGRIRVEDGELVVDPLVRHAHLEHVVLDDGLGGLLRRTARLVGHLPIRTRGTFLGSLAHADPAAEWCILAVALDATLVARSASGDRRLAASSFFEGPFTTALRADEVLVEARLPMLRGAGFGLQERSRTAGGFALVAAIAVLRMNEGSIGEARLAFGGVSGRPVRARAAESLLEGVPPEPDALAAAAGAGAEEIDPLSDAFASGDYRRHLAETLLGKALEEAAQRAGAA